MNRMGLHARKQAKSSVRISVPEGFRLWSRYYDFNPNPLLSLEIRTMTGKLENISDKLFLDIACGTARWMTYAASKGARVFGTDLVSEMLAIACRKPHITGCLVQGEACHLPFINGCADITVCSFALGYVREPECLVEELARVTRQGGKVFVSDLHPHALQAGWSRTFHHESRLYDIENYSYTCEQLIHAGNQANLNLMDISQPFLGEYEFSIMREAGKTVQIQEMCRVPAILVLEWIRS